MLGIGAISTGIFVLTGTVGRRIGAAVFYRCTRGRASIFAALCYRVRIAGCRGCSA